MAQPGILRFKPKNGAFPSGEVFCLDTLKRRVYAVFPDGREEDLADKGWANFDEALYFAIDAVQCDLPSAWVLLPNV
jgi:hypothetical protein